MNPVRTGPVRPPDVRIRRYRWHRLLRLVHKWCGLVAGVGVLWLGLTGIPLFLSDVLGLPAMPLPAAWQRSFYGVVAAGPAVLQFNDHRLLVNAGGTWTIDGHPVAHPPGQALDLIQAGDLLYVIGSQGVLLLSRDGEPVDRFDAVALGLTRIDDAGTRVAAGSPPAVCVRDDARQARCSDDGMRWSESAAAAPIDWHRRSPAPAGAEPIHAERFLQDIHALRFLGPLAPWLGALFGAALTVLAVTGLWSVLSTRRHDVTIKRAPFRSRHPHD